MHYLLLYSVWFKFILFFSNKEINYIFPQTSQIERRSVPAMGYITHTVSAPSLHGKTVGSFASVAYCNLFIFFCYCYWHTVFCKSIWLFIPLLTRGNLLKCSWSILLHALWRPFKVFLCCLAAQFSFMIRKCCIKLEWDFNFNHNKQGIYVKKISSQVINSELTEQDHIYLYFFVRHKGGEHNDQCVKQCFSSSFLKRTSSKFSSKRLKLIHLFSQFRSSMNMFSFVYQIMIEIKLKLEMRNILTLTSIPADISYFF